MPIRVRVRVRVSRGNLSYAGLNSLASRSLRGLYRLQVLDLQKNSLHTLPVDIFWDLTMLLYLDLSFNPLTAIPDIALSQLHHLETLVLLHNIFSSMNFGRGFTNLTKLSTLKLFPIFQVNDNCTENRHVSIGNDTFKNIADSPITNIILAWNTYGVNVNAEAGFLKPLKHVQSMLTFPDVHVAFPYFETSLKTLQTFIEPDNKRLTNASLRSFAKWNSSLYQLNIRLSGINGIEGYVFCRLYEFART